MEVQSLHGSIHRDNLLGASLIETLYSMWSDFDRFVQVLLAQPVLHETHQYLDRLWGLPVDQLIWFAATTTTTTTGRDVRRTTTRKSVRGSGCLTPRACTEQQIYLLLYYDTTLLFYAFFMLHATIHTYRRECLTLVFIVWEFLHNERFWM